MSQNFKNHTRYFPLHHFVITPLTLGLVIWSLAGVVNINGDNFSSILFKILASISLFLIALMARMYALKNQDRLIRLEMRQRYCELTGQSLKPFENQLNRGQIIALRFAGDEELKPLIERAIVENMDSKEIKLAVKDWQSDYHRV